jgi:guanidinoacetate N-methyltransferase
MGRTTIDDLGLFDGIFFHTYPLNEEEYMKNVHGERLSPNIF